MKALTVCQPYAELIARGEKPIENRTWATPYRGALLIHAGKSRAWLDDDSEADYPELVYGMAIATATLAACVPLGRLPSALQHHPHANGPWCWILTDVMRIRPVAMRGAQGLWAVPSSIVVLLEPMP